MFFIRKVIKISFKLKKVIFATSGLVDSPYGSFNSFAKRSFSDVIEAAAAFAASNAILASSSSDLSNGLPFYSFVAVVMFIIIHDVFL